MKYETWFNVRNYTETLPQIIRAISDVTPHLLILLGKKTPMKRVLLNMLDILESTDVNINEQTLYEINAVLVSIEM